MDIREIMGAILTISMFLMLANMIKRDHFDGDVLLNVPSTTASDPSTTTSDVYQDFTKMSRRWLSELPSYTSKTYGQRLKLCWNNSSPSKEEASSKGFVTFSLTDGPEYHVSQVGNAVLVAKHLGATLVLPEIIGSNGEKRAFEEIYDVGKFKTTMSGVIQVETRKPNETSSQTPADVKVPYHANHNYIMNNVGPVFQKTQNVRVISYLPSSAREIDNHMDPHSCWAIFEGLSLKPELQKKVDSVVGNLRSREPNGQFIAIDYKTSGLGASICGSSANEGMKNCYTTMEISSFFQRIGFLPDSTYYITHPTPDDSLRPLKDLYPKTFTKEEILQEAKIGETSELEKDIIDFHVCSVSEVFVPSKSGLFYANVAANRIATGRTNILLPAQITSSLAQDHVSSFIGNKDHPVQACFCE
ncbi:protein MANNAN SYNTHESIS-RELATED 1-like [Bidens hawaiensis]|uniref:protein MANNAN SYNTHESIS-RELATED 1-like n=1 Tax=Bidens hawaiensis TaxID=980011 RepID=UPI0040496866